MKRKKFLCFAGMLLCLCLTLTGCQGLVEGVEKTDDKIKEVLW